MNTAPQRPDRKKLSILLSGLTVAAATYALGQMSAIAEGPPGTPPTPSSEGATPPSLPTGDTEATPPTTASPLSESAPPVEDKLAGLNAELSHLKEQLSGTLSGYQIHSLEAVGEPAAVSGGGSYTVPLALKVVPTNGGDNITVDLTANRDTSGHWSAPSAADVREALRKKIAGNSTFTGQGVVGSTASENSGGKGSIDISAPADLQSVSKTARAQEDITGAAPVPDSLTLPFSKNGAPVVPLDGELPSSSDISPVPSIGKPYTPPVTSLDGPIDGAPSTNNGEAIQPNTAITPNAPKGPGASLDLNPSAGDDSALTPVEGSGGRTTSGPGSGGSGGPALPPKTEGTGPSLD